MRAPLFLRRWWNARQPPKPFVEGMTLEPGESAELLLAPPDELIAITQGPPIDDGDGKFHIDATLIVERRDGVQLRAKIRLEGESG
jgi:hypothetical protein